MNTQIIPVFCNDNNMANYAYLIKEQQSNDCLIIDAAESRPIIEELNKLSLKPTHILTTHHHFDHVGGNMELKQKYDLKIIAPQDEFDNVPGADIPAIENTPIKIGNLKFDVIKVPGHTLGHVLYHLAEVPALFTGDTLFNLCIGGLFEGNPDQMATSLNKIKKLDNNTLIFPGHEYTRSAITKDLLNKPGFEQYLQKMYQREQGNLAPSTLKEEKQFNPYLQQETLLNI